MTQTLKIKREYTLFWATFSCEDSYKRFSVKLLKGKRAKSELFEWIKELEKEENIEGYSLINCGVVED